MNSRLLENHLPVESLFFLPSIFVVVVVFRVFIPVVLIPSFYFCKYKDSTKKN